MAHAAQEEATRQQNAELQAQVLSAEAGKKAEAQRAAKAEAAAASAEQARAEARAKAIAAEELARAEVDAAAERARAEVNATAEWARAEVDAAAEQARAQAAKAQEALAAQEKKHAHDQEVWRVALDRAKECPRRGHLAAPIDSSRCSGSHRKQVSALVTDFQQSGCGLFMEHDTALRRHTPDDTLDSYPWLRAGAGIIHLMN